jgi:ATP-dependent Lon protease
MVVSTRAQRKKGPGSGSEEDKKKTCNESMESDQLSEAEDVEDVEGVEDVEDDLVTMEDDSEDSVESPLGLEESSSSEPEKKKIISKPKKKSSHGAASGKKNVKSIKIQIVSNNTKKKPKKKSTKSSTLDEKESDSKETSEENESESMESDDEDEEDDDEEEEETDPEEEYLDFCPKKLVEDPISLEKIRGLIHEIEKKTPTVEKLLQTKMRKRHKAEIFEWIMIYENTMPLSEERKALRRQIYNMMRTYKKEYFEYKVHKKQVKQFESKNKDFNELYNIQYSIMKLETNDQNKEAIYRKYMELTEKSEEMDDEFFKLKNWINTALQLPFDRIKESPAYINISQYLQRVRAIFDEELYGMEKVKEQLLLFIHGKLLNPDIKGCCLGLVGEPGVGKTSIARCLAKVMDFPFEQITFGGVNSAEFIRGFDYTYVGSRPGEIVRCLSRMKYKNGIIFFDEYEKISQNRDITACLLHITDFTQNNSFRDNYLNDLKIDLSSVWFIYSMNALPEDEALKDRIFVITVDGYKEAEKVRILCDYLLPKHLKNLNLTTDSVVISDEVAQYLIRKVCPEEKGIRSMEKSLKDLLSKICFLVTNQQTIKCSFMLPERCFPFVYPVKLEQTMVDVLLKDSVPKGLKHPHMYM